MSPCICPEDQQKIPSDKRLHVYAPNAVRREGATTVTDQTLVYIFRTDCPLHGYTVLEEEKGTAVA